jgi:hypothetical protein
MGAPGRGEGRSVTDEQHAYLQGYVRDLAVRLKLADWEISISRQACEHSAARSRLYDAQNRSCIQLSDDFIEHDADEQRATLVHELLHCHQNRQDRVFELSAAHAPPALGTTLDTLYREAQDVGIETLSWVIAPFMPPLILPSA